MAVTKTISIDGQEVTFRASAAVPRLYRVKFHRDIYKDLSALQKSLGENDENASRLDSFSLEMFENISFIMAKHADPSIPNTPEEWLERFNTFSIYQVLPEIIDLWGLNVKADVEAKKNFARLKGK
jgi:hypothetical protein